MATRALESLHEEVARQLVERSRRVSRGILAGGLALAGLMAAVGLMDIHRYAELGRGTGMMPLIISQMYFPFLNALLFIAFAWFYQVRARLVARRGDFVPGRLVGPREVMGSDVLSTDHGPTGVIAAGQAAHALATAGRKILPTERAGFELMVNGRWHWFEMTLFGGERPVVVGENTLLCFVDRGRFWFYPPSPYVVRVNDNAPETETFRRRVQTALEELSASDWQQPGPRDRVIRHSARRQWIAIGAIVLVLMVGYGPVLTIFGWPMALLLAFIVGAPIGFALLWHKRRS